MAFASDSDDDIVALDAPCLPAAPTPAPAPAQRTGPSTASSAAALGPAGYSRASNSTASSTKPTTSLLKELLSDSDDDDDVDDRILSQSSTNRVNGFQKSARPSSSTSTAGSISLRPPTFRTRSDTNLLSSSSTSDGLGSAGKSLSFPSGGMPRAHTTTGTTSTSSRRPALMPSSLKNSVSMFGSDSDDSGLSADEDIRKDLYKSRNLALDSQTSTTSTTTKSTTTARGRPRSDPCEKARAAEAKKVRC